MLSLMRTCIERANRLAARAQGMVNAAERSLDSLATATATTFTTFVWNVKPCVHATAISTHGKPYARRLQEILT